MSNRNLLEIPPAHQLEVALQKLVSEEFCRLGTGWVWIGDVDVLAVIRSRAGLSAHGVTLHDGLHGSGPCYGIGGGMRGLGGAFGFKVREGLAVGLCAWNRRCPIDTHEFRPVTEPISAEVPATDEKTGFPLNEDRQIGRTGFQAIHDVLEVAFGRFASLCEFVPGVSGQRGEVVLEVHPQIKPDGLIFVKTKWFLLSGRRGFPFC